MKITVAKLGMELKNKVNGNVYRVTEWDGTTAKAVSVNPETNELFEEGEDGYDIVEVNVENAICFRTLHIPADEVVPENYSVKDGKLLCDGKEVTEQGEIIVEEIISALPGYVVLAVKPREEKEELIDLFIYEPERDKFTKLIRCTSIPMPEVVKTLDGAVLLGYNQTHVEEEPDEDGVAVEVEYFDRSALMLVSNRKLNTVFFERPMLWSSLKEVAGGKDLFIIASASSVDDDRRVEKSKTLWYEYVDLNVENTFIKTNTLYPQPKDVVLEASIVNAMDGGILLKGADFIQYGEHTIKSQLAGKIKGNHLVDITRDGDDEIWSIATEEYEVTKIKKTRTKDRGNIYSIL